MLPAINNSVFDKKRNKKNEITTVFILKCLMIGLNAETEIKQFRLPQHKMQVMQRTDKTRSVFYLHIHK